jgi:hypothetical protein
MAEVRIATLGTLVLAASLPLAALGQSCVPDLTPD